MLISWKTTHQLRIFFAERRTITSVTITKITVEKLHAKVANTRKTEVGSLGPRTPPYSHLSEVLKLLALVAVEIGYFVPFS